MNESAGSSRPFSLAVRRADVFAYNFVLLGVWFVVDSGTTALTNGTSATVVGGVAMGGFSLLAGLLAYRNANGSEAAAKPASTALVALAAIETVLIAYIVVGALGRIT